MFDAFLNRPARLKPSGDEELCFGRATQPMPWLA